MRRFLLLSLLALNLNIATANFDYPLNPQQVAADTFVLEGKTEDFNKDNGGFIVNVAYIVTSAGVVVIDTGPSRRFGEQERALIEQSTGKKVIRVYLTHHHPDHFFGNQAFSDLPIYALPATTQGIKQEGESFSNNMYRMIGDWMRDTSVVPPNQVAQVGKETIGGHELELLAFKGHTHGDLAIFDHTTGVLFTGDLVFNQRAATTPHANMIDWLASLEQLLNISFKVLVPGHGKVTQDDQAIAQTRAYLVWLETILQQAARNGLDMNEVMMTPIPADFKDVALAQSELRRSVAHLYPALEAEQLKPAKQAE
jgi:uncharacterized sulfatase